MPSWFAVVGVRITESSPLIHKRCALRERYAPRQQPRSNDPLIPQHFSDALCTTVCVMCPTAPQKASSSPTMRRHQPFGRGQCRLLLLVLAFAGLGAAQEEPQDRGVVLGIKRAPGAIHEPTLDELCASVAQYGVTPPTTLSSDMEDRLRLTLYEVRQNCSLGAMKLCTRSASSVRCMSRAGMTSRPLA